MFGFNPWPLLGNLRVVSHIILTPAQPVGAQTALGRDRTTDLLGHSLPAQPSKLFELPLGTDCINLEIQ